MTDRVALICGIANERSLAAAAARALAAQGWTIACSYQGERVRERVERVAEAIQPGCLTLRLDLADAASLDAGFATLGERHPQIHGLLHAIAFGRLQGDDGDPLRVLDADAERYAEALERSARSLVELCRRARPLLGDDAAVVALSYLGAQRALAGYNLMGVAKAALEAEVRYLAAELGPAGTRVNALSAGPVRTLASSGVPGFAERLADHAARAPLRRNVSAEEVGTAAAFLLSPASSGITGQTIFVDAGFSIV